MKALLDTASSVNVISGIMLRKIRNCKKDQIPQNPDQHITMYIWWERSRSKGVSNVGSGD
jgi:hypothetical protein